MFATDNLILAATASAIVGPSLLAFYVRTGLAIRAALAIGLLASLLVVVRLVTTSVAEWPAGDDSLLSFSPSETIVLGCVAGANLAAVLVLALGMAGLAPFQSRERRMVAWFLLGTPPTAALVCFGPGAVVLLLAPTAVLMLITFVPAQSSVVVSK